MRNQWRWFRASDICIQMHKLGLPYIDDQSQRVLHREGMWASIKRAYV